MQGHWLSVETDEGESEKAPKDREAEGLDQSGLGFERRRREGWRSCEGEERARVREEKDGGEKAKGVLA